MSSSTLFSQAWHVVERAWRAHLRSCPTCSVATARRDFCAEGARLFRAVMVTP